MSSVNQYSVSLTVYPRTWTDMHFPGEPFSTVRRKKVAVIG